MSGDKSSLVAEPEHCLLPIVMGGHWAVETAAANKAALLPAIDRLIANGCASGYSPALVDRREGEDQSQDVIAEYQRQLESGDLAPRRNATPVWNARFKRQIERIAIPNQRLFTEDNEALAWLLSPEPAA